MRSLKANTCKLKNIINLQKKKRKDFQIIKANLHKPLPLILTLICGLFILFIPLSARATNDLLVTAYDQTNKGTAAGTSFSGNVIQTQNLVTIDFSNIDPAGRANSYSFVIEGFIYAPTDGVYNFETYSDDGVRLIVDGTLIIDNWTDHGSTIDTGNLNLLTGWKAIRIEHYEQGGGERLRFRWKKPGDASFSFPQTADLSTVPVADPTNGNTTLAATPTSVVADGATTSSVTVTLADANSNLLSASGGTVVLSATGSAVISAVTDNADGTYTATVTNTVAESVTISGTLDAAAITDTAAITFTVGSANPTNGNTTLAATPTSVVADGATTSSVTVTLADANSNLLSASGGTVVLSATGSAVISAVTDNADGTYTATVTNTVAESVTISGTLDAAAITDTAAITFTVGSADPTNGNTTLAATPTSVVADGATTSSVTVTLADANSNLLSASGGTVVLSATGSAVISAVTDNADGTYTATVTNTVAESVTISGTLDAAAITDTAAITFTVGSADPTNGNTTLAATPTSVVADGATTSSVTVTLADANSNLLSASGGTVVLSATGSAVISAVTDNADGTYTATVTNTVAESVTISGTLDAAAITDTAAITFTVGSADPTNGNTTLAATPTSVVADGATTSSVTVTLADANSNLLSASGGTVVLSATGSAVISAVTDNADGTYTATVTNTVAESVTISGTLDAAAITDTAAITFTVGSADPTNGNTTLAATPTSVVADGATTSSVTVTLADANSNLLSASGGTVVLSATGSAVISAVTDNADGTYTATVTNTVAESVTISGTLDAAAITDTAAITFIDINSPILVSSTPADNALSVELDQDIIFNFSENIIAGAGNIKLFEKDGLLVESFTVSSSLISGSTVTLNPAVSFKYNSAYFIQIPATAFKDTAGNAYAGITSKTALNFKTRLKTPKEGFVEVQEDIKTTIKSNTSKQISIFLKATNITVSSARDRFISNRIISSRSDLTSQRSEKSLAVERDTQVSYEDPARFASTGLIDKDTESSFDLRSSTRGTTANGQINGVRQSNNDRTRRYTGTQFNYTKSTDKTETGGASSQVVFEQERSDDLTVGRFIGSTFSKHSKIDANTTGMEIVIETVSLQFGSYFVHNISKDIFLDGYIAGSLLANKLEVNTTSITAEADYISRMGAIGLAVTGSLTMDGWEIRPTLALDYSAVSSQDVEFEVASEGGASNEKITAGNERQFSFTLAPDFRKSFDFKEGYWSQDSIISIKPKITCQRVYEDVVTKHCGQGAALNLTMQDKNAMKRLLFTLSVDKISDNTTYTANAFYKSEF